jgi:hypothetical protein
MAHGQGVFRQRPWILRYTMTYISVRSEGSLSFDLGYRAGEWFDFARCRFGNTPAWGGSFPLPPLWHRVGSGGLECS